MLRSTSQFFIQLHMLSLPYANVPTMHAHIFRRFCSNYIVRMRGTNKRIQRINAMQSFLSDQDYYSINFICVSNRNRVHTNTHTHIRQHMHVRWRSRSTQCHYNFICYRFCRRTHITFAASASNAQVDNRQRDSQIWTKMQKEKKKETKSNLRLPRKKGKKI